MIRTNLATIKTWQRVQLSQLPELLKSQGFQFAKRFSTDEHRIFVSQDGQYLLNITRNQAKVYSTKDQKTQLHAFSIIDGEQPEGSDKVYRV